MTRQYRQAWLMLIAVGMLATGCGPSQPFYFFDDGDMSHYRGVATQIEYPDVEPVHLAEVEGAMPPLTLRNAEPQEIWDLPLEEAVRLGLMNSKVLRTLGGTVVTPPTQLLRAPNTIASVYDPAINESNPRIGVEGALSAFDAQLVSSVIWQKNNRIVNVQTGATDAINSALFVNNLRQDYSQGILELRKTGATGGQYFLRNNTIYDQNNTPTRLFPSAWDTNIEAEFRHPLLQGAGVTFNRIAGPQAQPGFFFTQGVVLARISNDISIVDFEIGVRNLVADIETAYWELHYRYRNLDALIAGRDSALQTWRKVYALFIVSAQGGEAEKEAQAREQYFLFRSQVEASLSELYAVENRLRYIMGLAATDGRLIRPSDEPTTARINLDWYEVHGEGLARAQELRRQKWVIKQREMELIAARNFLLPRLDLLALYRWRGFGNDWWYANGRNTPFTVPNGNRLAIPGAPPPPDFVNVPGTFSNAVQNLLDGRYQEWQAGFTFTMPIGFRQAMAAVRQAQLNLARERSVYQDQELELSHQLSEAIRVVDRTYALSQTNFNRRVAAERNVEAVKAAYETGTVTLDLLLDAQRRLADAEVSYYRALVDYNLSIRDVHLRKGSLLEYNGVELSEGPWAGKAYFDARKRARERDAGLFIDYGFTQPSVYSRGRFQQFINGQGTAGGTQMVPGGQPTGAEEVPSPQPLPAGQPPDNGAPNEPVLPAPQARGLTTPPGQGNLAGALPGPGRTPPGWGGAIPGAPNGAVGSWNGARTGQGTTPLALGPAGNSGGVGHPVRQAAHVAPSAAGYGGFAGRPIDHAAGAPAVRTGP
ncbi:MAG: TolC family protein [Pirellulales bacterium]|nr:TolC family protein [Pirellulales bacterium]